MRSERKFSSLIIFQPISTFCGKPWNRKGYSVIAAPSGTVALQIAARAQPDLILLDILMPGIDGFETCRRLKLDETTADIPAIFITAQDETKSVVEGFGVGGIDYITKLFQT